MGKAQVWVFLLLLGAIVVQVVSSESALAAAKNKQPVAAVQLVNPKLVLYAIIGFVALELLSDAAPEFAVGIAGLLFVGSVLQKGGPLVTFIQGKIA